MKKLITAVVATMALGLSVNANAVSQQYFDKLDTNSDGYLDIAEFQVNLKKYFAKKNITDPAEQDKRAKNGFKKKDVNKDGKLSIEELSPKK